MRRVLDPAFEVEELTDREQAVDLVRSIGDFDVVVVDIRSRAAGSAEQERFIDPAVPRRGAPGRLTVRQRQILQLLADGGSTTVAAEELQVSEETVRTHTKNILARLEARNRAHAVAIGLRESLIE